MNNKEGMLLMDSKLFGLSGQNGFYGSLSSGNDVYYFDTNKDNTEAMDTLLASAKGKTGWKHRIFLGYRESCDLFYDLSDRHGNIFTAAVLVEGRVDVEKIQGMYPRTRMVFCMNRAARSQIVGSGKNYMVYNLKSRIPLNYSRRAAQEASGVLLYGYYGKTYQDEVETGRIISL